VPGPRLTAALLLLVIVLIIVALLRFTASGPRFRAADYPTLPACMAAIPREWAEGSIERTRAERACEHQERQRRMR
jgi:hypothetical protein